MYKKKLEEAKGFGEIFSLVKNVVAEKLGIHRAGLSLVLMDLPPNILAFHEMGSNAIVMNRRTLEAIALGINDRLTGNAYIFVTLLHEYLHSLGFAEEDRVRSLVHDIVVDVFGKDHPAYMAAVNPLSLIGDKQILLKRLNSSEPPSIVKDFDRESMPFIS